MPDVNNITERDKDILIMIAAGMTNKAIACNLGIAERTVEYHISQIFRKLGAETRVQAVVVAMKKGFLVQDESTMVNVD